MESEGTEVEVEAKVGPDISCPTVLHACVHTEKAVVVSSSCVDSVDRLVETVTGVQQRKQEFLLD